MCQIHRSDHKNPPLISLKPRHRTTLSANLFCRPERTSSAFNKVLCNSSLEKRWRDKELRGAAHGALVIDDLRLCNSWLSNMYISLIHTLNGTHILQWAPSNMYRVSPPWICMILTWDLCRGPGSFPHGRSWKERRNTTNRGNEYFRRELTMQIILVC